MKVTKKDVIRLLREEYEARIKGALNEVDMFDSTGQLIIASDLKVKHKPSGYVYTVAGTQGQGDDAKVVLRKPEEPRLNPPAEEKVRPPSPDERMLAFEDDDEEEDKDTEDMKDVGKKAHPKLKPAPDKLKKDRVFVVNRADFERNYEEA